MLFLEIADCRGWAMGCERGEAIQEDGLEAVLEEDAEFEEAKAKGRKRELIAGAVFAGVVLLLFAVAKLAGKWMMSVGLVHDQIRDLALQCTAQTIQSVNIQALNVTSNIRPDPCGVDAGQHREFRLSLNSTISHHLFDSEFQGHAPDKDAII